MARSSLAALAQRTTTYFRKHAQRYGLRPETVEARYILNWGGFVNASFQITDGECSYHLKLADDEEALESLDRWRALSELLSARYRAPRMVDWIEIPRMPFEGLLFEYFHGQQADLAAQPGLRRDLIDLLGRLHTDSALVNALRALGDEIPTCAEYFLSVYIDRFDEDLRAVAGDLPPFVSLDLLSWMMGETRELEGLARDLPEFQSPASAPTHGDLWPSNILVDDQGDWRIIDWDDLGFGDPALEFSILLGPLWRHGGLSLEQAAAYLPEDAALHKRFALCLRALVLDEVIDSLADWVESGFAPDHQAEVRVEKERVHREALALYHRLYD